MMPNKDDATERIDDYLAGRLDEAARRQVEERLQTDENFRREVALQQRLTDQIRLRGEQELRRQMHQWSQEDDATVLVHPAWKRYRYVYAIAASLAGGLLLVWFWWRNQDIDRGGDLSASVHVRTFKLPLESTNLSSGYAGGKPVADSVWIQVRPHGGRLSQYRFTDTLSLYTDQIRTDDRLRLSIGVDGRYRLTVNDTIRYRLERGFRQVRPLEP